MRGSTLTQEDKLRRRVIQDIMCQGILRFKEVEDEFGIVFMEHFGKEIGEMTELMADALILLGADELLVTRKVSLFLSNITKVFYEYQCSDSTHIFYYVIY